MNGSFLRRILFIIIRMFCVLFAVTILTFVLVSRSPIDPVTAYVGGDRGISEEQREQITEYWGLNQPMLTRYFIWGHNLLKGDMGESITYRQPVIQVIKQRFLPSLALMGSAFVFSGMLGFVIGILCGVFRNSILDRVLKNFCLLMASMPIFWFGLLVVMLFSIKLKWFPLGLASPIGLLADEVTIAQRVHHLVLPVLILGITGMSNVALHTRQKMVEALESEYILYARAKGESKWQIIYRHALRNIALPAITLQLASFSELFGGSVLAEQVFSYPGLGNAAVTAGLNGDMALLCGIALFTTVFVFTGNLTANLLYIILNPKTREEGEIG